jgi:hypothetical protein
MRVLAILIGTYFLVYKSAILEVPPAIKHSTDIFLYISKYDSYTVIFARFVF